MSSGQLILKILSGAYSGAELSLEKNEYVLGSALECDIAIEDAHLAPSHFKIQIVTDGDGGQSIHIQVLIQEHPVTHNNRPVEGNSFEVRPCDRVQVGEFVFGIGPANTPWPPYEQILERDRQEEQAAEQMALEAEKQAQAEAEAEAKANGEAAEGDEAGDNAEEGANASDDSDKKEGADVEEASDEADSDSDSDSNEPKWQQLITNKGVIAASVTGLVLLVSLVFIIGQSDDSEMNDYMAGVSPEYYPGKDGSAPMHPFPETDQSNGFDGDSSVSSDTIQINSDTNLILNGQDGSGIVGIVDQEVWQPNEADRKILADAKKSAASMLDAYKFSHLQIEKGTQPLTLIVRGYTADVDKWKKLKAVLNRDIRNINQIIDYVETPWTRMKQLEQMLFARGLDEESEVYMTDEGLLVKTSLSARDEQKWLGVEREFMQLFKNQPSLYRIKDKAPWLEIQSVNFGYEPYLVTSDGTKYTVGAHVKNGYVLDKISPEGIVLNNDGQIKNLSLP